LIQLAIGRSDILAVPTTAIIANYNGADYLARCVSSFREQTTPFTEIMVVDAGSTDGSPEMIHDGSVSVDVYIQDDNRGYGAALNLGMQQAQGEIVVFSNIDLTLDPNWLAAVHEQFEEHPKCGLVASKILYMDEPQRINSTGMLFYADFSAINRGMNEMDEGQYQDAEEVFGANGAVMAFRRSVLTQIGGFDERYFLFREEDELMWRMKRHGWVSRYAPEAIVYHKRSASTGLFSPLKLYYSERNRLWNILKHLPLRCVFTTIPAVFNRYLGNLRHVRAGGTSKAEQVARIPKWKLALALLRAWGDAILGAPSMLRKRRQYNQTSTVTPRQARRWVEQYPATLEDMIK
jgi:GT2 family glycosyltransferase